MNTTTLIEAVKPFTNRTILARVQAYAEMIESMKPSVEDFKSMMLAEVEHHIVSAFPKFLRSLNA